MKALQDIALTARIRAIHRRSGEAYGAPSIHAELADDHGIRIGRKRVARLMREAGLKGVPPPKFVATTIADAESDRALDKVDRRFSAEGSGSALGGRHHVWCAQPREASG